MNIYTWAGESFWGQMFKLSINFEEILSRAHKHFEEQSRALDSSIITINYCIIINAHYDYIV
jgi:hemoglobin-like flavoprotein